MYQAVQFIIYWLNLTEEERWICHAEWSVHSAKDESLLDVPICFLIIIGGIYALFFIRKNKKVIQWKREWFIILSPIVALLIMQGLTYLVNYIFYNF